MDALRRRSARRRAARDSRRRRVVVRDAACIIGAHELALELALARPPLLMNDGRRQHGHVVVFDTTVAPAPFEEWRRRRRRLGQLVEGPLVLLVRCLYVGSRHGRGAAQSVRVRHGAGDVAAPVRGQGRGHGPGDGDGLHLSMARGRLDGRAVPEARRCVAVCRLAPRAVAWNVRTGDEAAPARFVVGGACTTWLLPQRSPAQIPRVVK